jgi:hypothetical protein
MMHVRIPAIVTAVLAVLVSAPAPRAQSAVPFVGMGDSLGEGVQSGDASAVTQSVSFLNLMAWRLGADFPLPLIKTNIWGAVGSVDGRSRYDLSKRTRNLSVSGADVTSILTDAATAATAAQIDSETELVLFPEIGSQIEIAERLRPQIIACWIGANDALGAALAFDQLDASQLTPIPEFTARFTELVDRIDALGSKAVFGTVPNISAIAFLANRQDLIRFLGNDYGLPNGHLTALSTVFLVRLGLENASVFSNPNFVLDPAEQAIISTHVEALNDVIRSTAASRGMAVAEMHDIFQYLSAAPFNFFGRTLTTRFLGGIFSLDGVHPSNTGQGLAAYFFIEALNQKYGPTIPQMEGFVFNYLVSTDPHIDHDKDGRVRGRFGAGVLETMLAILNISGDTNETSAINTAVTTAVTPAEALSPSLRALNEYERQTGKDLRKMSRQQRLDAVRALFGLRRPVR